MKIIVDEKVPFIEGRIKDAETVMLPASCIDRDAVRDADALIIRTRTRCDESLLAGSGVRMIATATIGTDHIDRDWCEANGITVRNAPGCNAPGVALYVWSCLLRTGFDPSRHTLGVAGCGNVGSIVAQWGRRLGARVLVCDPPRRDAGFSDHEYLDLRELLQESDAVTLHTPLTHDGAYPTFHMMGTDALGMMRKGATIVNAARGEVIDTRALIAAIGDGRIGKAIIDTWENEPDIDRHLLGMADIATCHIAGYSVEGKQRASRMALEALHETLGITIDTKGLQEAYKEPYSLSPDMILSHYDPAPMTETLKKCCLNPEYTPGSDRHPAPYPFEALRNSYPLHPEIL